MNRFLNPIRYAGLAVLLAATACPAAGFRPNVIVIMADDLGAENLACYGNSVYSTPHLDRMAAAGARFENAYATPVCTPTRAMILAGLYPNRSGFLERLDSPLDPEKHNRLPVHLKTFGHVLQSAGYATAIAGKWHLGDFQNIALDHDVDGMDLSHNLLDTPGKDRKVFAMAFEGGVYFVRDERFRLHEDGRFYDVPVTSNASRYNMNAGSDLGQYAEARDRLQPWLEEFMAIKQTDTSYTLVPFGTNGDNFKNAQDRARKKTPGNGRKTTD